MNYILVYFESGVTAYQEIDPYGDVVRYLDESGQELFVQPPVGVGCVVVNAEPPRLSWMQ